MDWRLFVWRAKWTFIILMLIGVPLSVLIHYLVTR